MAEVVTKSGKARKKSVTAQSLMNKLVADLKAVELPSGLTPHQLIGMYNVKEIKKHYGAMLGKEKCSKVVKILNDFKYLPMTKVQGVGNVLGTREIIAYQKCPHCMVKEKDMLTGKYNFYGIVKVGADGTRRLTRFYNLHLNLIKTRLENGVEISEVTNRSDSLHYEYEPLLEQAPATAEEKQLMKEELELKIAKLQEMQAALVN